MQRLMKCFVTKGKMFHLKINIMKKSLIITLFLMIGMSLHQTYAQEDMQYIFGGGDKHTSVSAFAGIFNEFSAVDKEFAFSMGGGAALLINRKFFFGGYGMGLTTRHMRSFEVRTGDGTEQVNLYTRFGHGGFWLGYIHKPQNAVHWGANLKLGWGGITLNDKLPYKYDYDPKWKNVNTDYVFVVNPEINVGLNLLKWMRINVGAGYRLVTGVDKVPSDNIVEGEYFDDNAFSNFTGNITLAFGWFNK